MLMNNNEISIYTDGSSLGNPGPGGYGAVIYAPKQQLRKELFEGFRKTTNNRMELLAVIVALEALKQPNQKVVVHSDSTYVVRAVEKRWLWNWLKNGFKGKKNQDLWRRFLQVFKKHQVRFQWVEGHTGITENERCDQLATAAAAGADLLIDKEYENS